MITSKKWASLIALVIVFSMILTSCGPTPEPKVETVIQTVQVEVTKVIEKEGQVQTVVETVVETVEVEVPKEVQVEVTAVPEPVDRVGGWLDMVIVVEEPSAQAAVSRLDAGEIDIYAYTVADAEVFETVKQNDKLIYTESVGSYNEVFFNPVGPTFPATGALNPFSEPKIREAMNWLVDRDYIIDEILGGLGRKKLFPIVTAFPDYARYADVFRAVEAQYPHDPDKAAEVIGQEMEALGAELVDGKWNYEGEPVTLIFIIRSEDERRQYGDYVANLLEDIGFTVDRQYKTGAEASPIWISSDPNDGLWHLYTGGWITTSINRDQANNFDAFYTPRGIPWPAWQEFKPSPEFDEVADLLARNDFSSMEERADLFKQAIPLSIQNSQRIWLYDQTSFTPRLANVEVTADLAGAVAGAWLWPYTLKRAGEVGGAMTVAMPSILTAAWNPIGGSNWIYDMSLQRATMDRASLPDPFTGLRLPQRLANGEVYAVEGLPVSVTYDWVTLEFLPEIPVPDDAWVDWDAASQTFVTASEYFTEPATAQMKVVCNFDDATTALKWHDGSVFDVADMVMYMIMQYDVAKEESTLYDESQGPIFQSFMDSFKGWRVVSENPIVIEYYTDQWALDAEDAFSPTQQPVNPCAWPFYPQGGASWHMMGIGILTEESGEATFTPDKANLLEVDRMSYIGGPTLEILAGKMVSATAETYIPFEPTLGQFITEDEATTRWANYNDWYTRKGHLWIGNGPYYLERGFPVEGTVILKHNPEFPDPSTKWAGYSKARLAEVEIDGPGRVTIGDEAAYDVYVTFEGEPYPAADIIEVKYLVFDATGALAFTGVAEATEDGLYQITFTADQTGQLEDGAGKLEVAVVPLVVSIPTFESFEFVAAP